MKNSTLTLPSRAELIGGWIYLPIYLLVLPTLMSLLLSVLSASGRAQLLMNVAYGGVNVLVLTILFRRYLIAASQQITARFGRFLLAVGGGLAIYYFGTLAMTMLTQALAPGLENVNNNQIAGLSTYGTGLIFAFTVAFAPIAEELLFRGVVFSSLYRRSRLLAYAVSIGAFSLIHVLGYVGSYPLRTLALCFLQYLPASFGLAWAMEFSGTIWANIAVHMLANILALLSMLISP